MTTESGIRLEFAQFGHFDSFDVIRSMVSMASVADTDLPAPIATGLKTMYYVDKAIILNTMYYYRVRVWRGEDSFLSDEVQVLAGNPAIEFFGGSSVYFNGASYVAVPYPSGLVEGDLILLHTVANETYGPQPTPSGFTPVPGFTSVFGVRVFQRTVTSGGLTGSAVVSASPANNIAACLSVWRVNGTKKQIVVKSVEHTSIAMRPGDVRNWVNAPATINADASVELMMSTSNRMDTYHREVESELPYATVINGATANDRIALFYKEAYQANEGVRVRYPTASTSGIYPQYTIYRMWLGLADE